MVSVAVHCVADAAADVAYAVVAVAAVVGQRTDAVAGTAAAVAAASRPAAGLQIVPDTEAEETAVACMAVAAEGRLPAGASEPAQSVRHQTAVGRSRPTAAHMPGPEPVALVPGWVPQGTRSRSSANTWWHAPRQRQYARQ